MAKKIAKKAVQAEVAKAAESNEIVAQAEVVENASATEVKNLPAVVNQPQLPASNEPEIVVLERVETEQPQPEAVLPNCAKAKSNRAKPQPKMLRKIASIGEHPGKGLRIKRFHLYRVGMTLQHCKETEGLDHLDVGFYVENGLMTLAEPTKEELAAVEKQWQKDNTETKAA